jgi:ribosomal protein L13E
MPTRRRHESYTVNMIHDAELHTNHPQALGMIVDWRRHDPVVIHA